MTLKFPFVVNLYVGFCWVEVAFFSPKVQDHGVGEFVLVSLNATVKGFCPVGYNGVKLATGLGCDTIIGIVNVSLPYSLIAVRVTS